MGDALLIIGVSLWAVLVGGITLRLAWRHTAS